jgi:uncharacterized protein (DUF2384 family)
MAMAVKSLLPDLGLGPSKAPDLADKATQERLSRSGIQAFFRIADKWHLKTDQAIPLFGKISDSAFFELKKKQDKVLSQDELTRVSLLIGIFKALNILFSQKLANEWVLRPNKNPLFHDMRPVDFMIKGGIPGLLSVRRFLDSARGGR